MSNLSIPSQKAMSHISYIEDLSHIENLSCHGISIKAACTGSAEFGTEPPEADIFIYEENQGGYIPQNIQTGTISNPSRIDGIECTSLTRSNRFKLSRLGYIDVEGILEITQDGVYSLNIYMEKYSITEMGGWLFPAVALGALMYLLFGKDKKKTQKT